VSTNCVRGRAAAARPFRQVGEDRLLNFGPTTKTSRPQRISTATAMNDSRILKNHRRGFNLALHLGLCPGRRREPVEADIGNAAALGRPLTMLIFVRAG